MKAWGSWWLLWSSSFLYESWISICTCILWTVCNYIYIYAYIQFLGTHDIYTHISSRMSNPHPLRSSIAMSIDNWPSLTMCILVIALQCHPRFPFICAHNRDELLDSSECRVTSRNHDDCKTLNYIPCMEYACNMSSNMGYLLHMEYGWIYGFGSSSFLLRSFPWLACKYLLLFSIGKAKRSSFAGWSARKVWFVVWTRRNGRWYRLRLAGRRSFAKVGRLELTEFD